MTAADLADRMDRVKLSALRDHLDELEYPLSREAARERCEDVVLVLADGEEPLAAVIERSGETSFGSAEALTEELFSLLPRRAVGEPYQSEGEG